MNGFARYAVSIGTAAALLAGCGGTQPAAGAPRTPFASRVRHGDERGYGTVFALTTSGTETVLHSFGGGSADGAYPHANLLNVNGTIYGTTRSGGAYNGGTLFAISSSGSETIIHSFGASGDGAEPTAGLVNVDGKLYGTTYSGGSSGDGVVFDIRTSGAETVVHSFSGYPRDGAYPDGDLLDVSGTLYGTTKAGGSVSCGGSKAGCGTVFSVAASGTEDVLFSFGAKHQDCCPSAGVISVNGTLYGTTVLHHGKIFKIDTSGSEHVVHKFKGYPGDGSKPYGGLIAVNGTLYGTTELGGTHQFGTVFAITTSGSETELYSFSTRAQGLHPHSNLVNVDGTLYGTATDGGTGHGTVFAITPSGTESVIYSFKGYPYDGQNPYAGLINVSGTLYGTTEYGAAN